MSSALEHRMTQLAKMGCSAAAMANQLHLEGYRKGASRASCGRFLAEYRGERHAAWAAKAPASAPLAAPPAARPDEADEPVDAYARGPYIADDDAINAYVAEIGEWLDRRVDAAVAREVGDLEALRDRLINWGLLRGLPCCAACGVPLEPKGTP